jgi:superfamily I DNA and RNA helicase
LSEHKKAAIRGVAGSGKTVLALAKAQEMARSGSRTLLLCYNALLKDWLQNAIPDELQGILKIDNYHGVASDMCKMAGVYFGPGFGKQVDQEFWNNIAPEKLMEACRLLDADKKFDAVVVDEGQDFQDLWWISLEGLFRNYKDPDCFYVFYDPKQNIFVEQLSLPPGLGTAYPLKTNCRNTEKIATHCAGLVDEPSKVRAGAPVGEEPVFATAPNMRDAFSQAGSIVRSWCTGAQSGLRPSQVAVLAAGSSVKYWPHKFDALNVTQDLEKWRKDEGVLLASWSRFKGLEADAVVLIESADGDGIRDQANRYVARSRAKHLLHVIQVK